MSRRAVILQPGYLPWLGFFDMAHKADVFILLDDVQFTVRDWRTRNRIRTDRGVAWLSVPVSLERPHFTYVIRDVPILHEHRWVEKHLGSLQAFYKRSPFFDEVYPFIERHLLKRTKYLVDLNNALMFELFDYLGIPQSKFIFSSKLDIEPDMRKELRLLSILMKVQPKVGCYLSGNAAKGYLNESLFGEYGIDVEWHNYRHPFYNQSRWNTKVFISHLSVVDLLFNHGRQSIDIVTGKCEMSVPEELTTISADDSVTTILRKGCD